MNSCPLEITPHDTNIQERTNADNTANEQMLLESISLKDNDWLNFIFINF